jgi:hypothetical protein
MPTLNPGMAMLEGRVADTDGAPLAEATVTVLDSAYGAEMATTTTGSDGRFMLSLLARTTITLRAEATGYARGYVGSFEIERDATSRDLELFLIPTARLEQLNSGAGDQAAQAGVVALQVRSTSESCDPAGGTITMEPAALGHVVYARPGDGTPDDSLAGVQSETRPMAWVLGVRGPGAYYRFRFDKPGCTQKSGPVSWAGRAYTGQLSVEAKALTYGELFVE